jgi:hypothetical protein
MVKPGRAARQDAIAPPEQVRLANFNAQRKIREQGDADNRLKN